MQITLNSTEIFVSHEGVSCRVWEGKTEGGSRVTAFIPLVAVSLEQDYTELAGTLKERQLPDGSEAEAYMMAAHSVMRRRRRGF